MFEHPNPTAAGIVCMDADSRISRFVEKPPADQIFSTLANAGVYVLDPAVFALIPDGRPSDFGRDIFPALLAQSMPLYGMPLGGYLSDTGTPGAYRQANFDCLAGRTGIRFADPALWVAPSARVGRGVRFHGQNIVGAGAEIGDGTSITGSILLAGAKIAPDARIENSIVGDGFQIEHL